MTTAIQSVWLGQLALSSRDLVIHGNDAGAPGVREALRATMLGAVHGALLSLTREQKHTMSCNGSPTISRAGFATG